MSPMRLWLSKSRLILHLGQCCRHNSQMKDQQLQLFRSKSSLVFFWGLWGIFLCQSHCIAILCRFFLFWQKFNYSKFLAILIFSLLNFLLHNELAITFVSYFREKSPKTVISHDSRQMKYASLSVRLKSQKLYKTYPFF